MRDGKASRPWTMLRRVLGCGILVLLGCAPLAAQPTNAEALGRLAADCLADVPPDAFVLSADLPAYLRAPLLTRWQERGARVYVDTTRTSVPYLRLDPPRASVVYARAPRRRYARTVRLQMPFTLTSPAGELLRAGTCDEAFDDVIDRRRMTRLEDATYPETVGGRPAPGWVRRYAEPVVLGSAVVVSTLLFFSLRSR